MKQKEQDIKAKLAEQQEKKDQKLKLLKEKEEKKAAEAVQE